MKELKELQEELIEKIFLIPVDDSGASGKRALEIINQLNKKNINDIITTGSIRGTALDYVIIADSQGDPSEKKRINNRTLLELEEAIKAVEGKTSEELEPTQRNGEYDHERMFSSIRDNIRDAIADGNTDMLSFIRNTIRDAIADYNTDMLLSLRNTILAALNREAVNINIIEHDRPRPLLHQFSTANDNNDILSSLCNTIRDALNREAIDINIREYAIPYPLLHQFATTNGNTEVTRATLDSPSMDVENVTIQQNTIERQNAPDNPR